jgi:membrane fusion protein, multidrug efflux system
MDGDARRSEAPQNTGYNVHFGYAVPSIRRLDARPPQRRREDERDELEIAPKRQEPDDRNDHDIKAGDGGGETKAPMSRWKKLLSWAIGIVVLLALIVAGALYWLHSRNYVRTDDAFVDGHISQISSQVAGRVIRVAIDDNQQVRAGQVLVELDPRDYRVKLDQARAQRAQAVAQLEQARAGLMTQQASVDQAAANVRVAEADLGQAQTDLARYRGVDPKAVSRQQVDTASSTTKSAQARVEANRQAVAAAHANVESQKALIEAAQANVTAADVAVANAELQLSYTTVTAPRDGTVARRTVELGNYINPGQALLAVVGEDRWITANFKETDLAGMKVGQPVRISVDSCPNHGLSGTVDSFQPGSGSIFSALPAENATGNYVKVVQRVPVKITIQHEDAVRCQLSPGMSVVPSVKVN